MLDDLREQASTSTFEEAPEPREKIRPRGGRFLGMTAFQRFFVALLLFMITCILGGFILVVSEKIVIPFL